MLTHSKSSRESSNAKGAPAVINELLIRYHLINLIDKISKENQLKNITKNIKSGIKILFTLV